MGRNPMRQDLPPPIRMGAQFGQVGQIGQVSGPSLGEMLSQRGFEMPKMKTGVEASIALMYKDPITGKMKSGGPNAASHAKAMSDFYGKNPDALNIAKQHQQDQQYNPGGGRDRFNASQIMTGGQSGKEQIGGHQDAQIGMQFTPLVAASLPSPPRITNEQDFIRTRGPDSLGAQLGLAAQFGLGGDRGQMGPPQEIMPQPILSTGRPMSGTGQAPPPDPNTIRFSRGDGGTLPPNPNPMQYQPTHDGPGSMGSMVKSNPYSAPPQMGGGFGGQMGGGMGGGQGMGQFMQFMQQMMQMFQQIQGGGGRGMGGGFQGPSQFMPQQQQYGQYQPQRNQYQQNQFMPQQQQFGQRMAPTARLMTQGPASMMQPQRMSNQFNPNNAFGGY